jgi:hypothetical protein
MVIYLGIVTRAPLRPSLGRARGGRKGDELVRLLAQRVEHAGNVVKAGMTARVMVPTAPTVSACIAAVAGSGQRPRRSGRELSLSVRFTAG